LASGRPGLKKIAIDGGAPVILCDAANLSGASWGQDGNIIAALGFGTLSRVPSSGGKPSVVADFAGESIDPRWPQVLPGSRDVLFTAVGPQGPNSATVSVLSLADGTRTPVVQGGTFGRYVADRYVTYVNQGTLFAVPFDHNRIAPVSATPIPVLSDVAYSSTFGFAQFDISNSGTFVFRRSAGRGQLVPTWIEPSGETRPLRAKPGEYTFPRLSGDARRLAFALTESGVTNVWVTDLHDDRMVRLKAAGGEFSPTWSHDWRVLVLGSRNGLRWIDATGSSEATPLTTSSTVQVPWSFSPDGTRLAFHELSPSTGFDLWTVAIRRTERGLVAGKPEPFLRTPAYETYPTFSPDGRWMAYGSGAFGRWSVYVRPFPDDGRGEVRISDSGGRIPLWLPNGRELLYRTDDQRLMIVAYSVKNGSFVAERPRPWTARTLGDTGVLSNLDVDPTGTRVLALMPAGTRHQQSPNHVTIRLNAADEVRRRLTGPSPAR
jgi:serine/threonine-protein kinase